MTDTVWMVPFKRRPKFGKGRTYDPAANRYEAAEIRRAYTGPLHYGPVKVTVDVFKALPKRTPKRVESEPDVTKPDADNVAKAVMDALNGVAYTDDAQVAKLVVTKHDRTRCKPHVMFDVEAWDGD